MNQTPVDLVIALAAESWSTLTDLELAAAHASATFDNIPTIQPENIAFRAAHDMNLVDVRGRMHSLTFQGLERAAKRLR